jgi:aspartate-semialdehyde dehydrogenase
MKVAVVGAPGMVGQVMLQVLHERKFPVTELIPVASEKSLGKTVDFNNQTFSVVTLEMAVAMKPDVPARRSRSRGAPLGHRKQPRSSHDRAA